jgi:hypothetical protein
MACAHRTNQAAAWHSRDSGSHATGLAAPSLKQQVAIVLARQRDPLLAREVPEQMPTHFAAEWVPTVAEVRTVEAPVASAHYEGIR